MSRVIFEKEYVGFEDASDLERDMAELLDGRFNPAAAGIPGEFTGTLKVVVTYTPDPDEQE